jgi:hypothetical protein
MIGIYIILAHLCGDYLFQNQWMAEEKTKKVWVAILHADIYTACYVPLVLSLHLSNWHTFWILYIIFVTHGIIDHWRLVKPFIWFRNQLAPRYWRYLYKMQVDVIYTPYKGQFGEQVKPGISLTAENFALNFWLMVIADNTIHLLINVGTLRWFG